jgi:antitoxin (DNA-binding transcriptional repressor) of toxin-antitoxin stability system
MQVNLQYAEDHLADLVSAVDAGQEVEISRPDKPAVRLILVSPVTPKSRSGMIGSGKGKIWVADDWDSKETNEEIARIFNDGPVFPQDREE